jgi:hypothetical protein
MGTYEEKTQKDAFCICYQHKKIVLGILFSTSRLVNFSFALFKKVFQEKESSSAG